MNCKSFEELIALQIENDLPLSEAGRVENHLTECVVCREFARELKESQSDLKQLREVPDDELLYQQVRHRVLNQIAQSHRSSRTFPWRALLIAASIAVAAMAGFFVVRNMLPSSSTPAVISKKNNDLKPNGVRTPDKPHNKTADIRPPEDKLAKSTGVEKTSRLKQETIVVAENPVVNAGKTASAANPVNREYFDKIPTGRDPWVVIEQSPGTENDRINVGGSETGDKTGLFARGSKETETEWNYDGVTPPPVGTGLPAEPPPPPAAEPAPAPSPDLMPHAEQPPAPEMPAETPPLQETAPSRTPVDQPSPRAPSYYDFDSNEDLGSTGRKSELRIFSYDGVRQQETERISNPYAAETLQGTLRAQKPTGEFIGEFPLKHTEVTADISGYLARTVVQQKYTNPYTEAIEAVYVFPLPAMAAINDFVMEAGDRKIIGIVRPRHEAEQIYREAKARGQTASLLTQERPNVFTQNVANIEPRGSVSIQITYFETLTYDRGYYEYVFPMVVGPRYIPGTPQQAPQNRESGHGLSAPTDQVPDADRITPPAIKPGQRSGHDIGITLRMDAGLPVQDLKCVTHQMKITDQGDTRRELKLTKADSIPNRDLVVRWSVAGAETQFGVLTHRSNLGGFFTLMMQPSLQPADQAVSPREITFILDVSGSMSGIPVEMSKAIVRRSLDRMRPDDIFNIFYFASGNGQLWHSPQPRTDSNIAAAKNFLQTLQGSGGTEMLEGVRRALQASHDPKYLQMYVFLSDGFVGNEQQILRVIQQDRGPARFFAFGIGSSVNRYLIDGIGEHGGGTSQVVIPRDRHHAERAVSKFFDSIDSPVLTDITIDWNGLPVTEVFPGKLSDLFAGQTISVIGRFNKDTKGTAYIRAKVGERQLRIPVRFHLPKKQSANAALPSVWAKNKVHDLLSRILTASSIEKKDLSQQITDLGVKYRLITPFTSFVAVDESRVVSDGNPMRVLQPVELPENVSYEGIFGERPMGQVFTIPGWGITLQMTASGKIRVCSVTPKGAAANLGIVPGATLLHVNRTLIHGLAHFESLILQSPGHNAVIGFQPGGEIELPLP